MSFSTIVVLVGPKDVIADKFRSIVQRNTQILAEELGQVPLPNRGFTQSGLRDEDRLTRQRLRHHITHHSHFFHLNRK
jgi:hypothetical protein